LLTDAPGSTCHHLHSLQNPHVSPLLLKGIDVYFDNVGGEILDQAFGRLADGARIVLCGAISQYKEAEMAGPGVKTT
jgi:NADPH-dependent curcumin reductase CurA